MLKTNLKKLRSVNFFRFIVLIITESKWKLEENETTVVMGVVTETETERARVNMSCMCNEMKKKNQLH